MSRYHYPDALPITARKDEILAAIRDHQVVVVAGETGSGKSTQLPKMCLEAGRGSPADNGNGDNKRSRIIGHTQPRRIAARTLAERIASELDTNVGGLVGYAVRFTDRVGPETRVKLMTDGILLAELQRDRMLSRYDTIIVDEAHERSLNIDFILGYLKQLLPRRPDLKVIVTSATIDTARFSEHFGGAPIVEVSGRTYPVEVRYRPFGDEPDDDRDQTQAICDAVLELGGEGDGDVLVFLSGEREIHDTADALARMELPGTEILPLYARLSAAEQHRVFHPHRGRRIVLATNVAETSLTVPGVRYVVDPGTARISRYSRRTKVQRLPIEPVSQASANQRAGRCGRVAPGVCIRLYAEDDFLARPEFTEPEILRTNLASVILQMTAIGLGDVARFPFVDPPDARNVKDGVALLEELGALEGKGRLTKVGRKLAALPVDPRLARMVVEAERNGCVREVMVIAAALSIQDPRERPTGAQEAATASHARFANAESDFVSLLNLWTYLRERQAELSSNQFRKLCRNEFLNYLRVREWQDIFSQLRQMAGSIGISASSMPAGAIDHDRIHRSLLAGLLSHVGVREGDRTDYLGARNARFVIAPGSALYAKRPRWVMAGELVETNRMWARVVARVQPSWIEGLAGHLVKRSHGDPWWDAARGAAMVNERVTLYGLPIVAGRRVPYARVDHEWAREMFLRNALVEGDWNTHHAFAAANQELLAEVRALEDRARRRVVVSDDALVDFFAARVPADVTSGATFDRWWKDARPASPDLLTLTRDDVIVADGDAVTTTAYPDVWRDGDRSDGLELALTYEFSHGGDADGVTVHVPLPLLNQVDAAAFEWQIPGLREELVTELIRSLPKAVRRSFVPAPDVARAFLASGASPRDGRLLDVLTHRLGLMTGDPIPAGSWSVERVPDHLRMTFSVEDDDGTVLAAGKDLDALRDSLGDRLRSTIVATAAPAIEQDGLQAWPAGPLPRTVEAKRGGHVAIGYPALVDAGDSVSVRVLGSAAEQEHAMWAGTRRLLLLSLPSQRRLVDGALGRGAKLALARLGSFGIDELADDCIAAAVDELIDASGGPAWDDAGFTSLRAMVRDELAPEVERAARAAGEVVVSAASVAERLDGMGAPSLSAAVADLREQMARLVFPGFVSAAGMHRLPDVARYLVAAHRRLDKLPSSVARDLESMRKVHRLERDYDRLVDSLPRGRDMADVEHIGWMLEELRVSLFAQTVGTAGPVSEKRIAREIERLSSPG